MLRTLIRLLRCRSGAIAPTIALSLTGLIAVGGIAFDYSRLAAMDTELQSAADQAALAAASQLDGQEGAQDRARAAAQNLVSNLTYFANDGDGPAVDIPDASIVFYVSYDPETGALGDVASDDAEANYVQVTVEGRAAEYALTPIVAAFSGETTAKALATLDSAYCNMPPFMMCKPAGFDPAASAGKGLRLVIGSADAPGNFGFLQTGFGSGADGLAKAIGWNGSAGGCVAARGVVTEPGVKQSVRAAYNTRFDMSEGGQQCPDGRSCSPSMNVRKDLVKGSACGTSGNQGWEETPVPYRAPNTTPLGPTNKMTPTNTYPDNMGYPRDLCHAVSVDGSCTGGRVGSGTWDRNAYFKVNYGWDAPGSGANAWTTKTGLPTNATRYQVYMWEFRNPAPAGTTGGIGRTKTYTIGSGRNAITKTLNSQPVCRPPGVSPEDTEADRRRTTLAVVDCTGLNGRATIVPTDLMDVFLVEPAFQRGTGTAKRTDDGDVYVEVIGTRPLPGINGSSGAIIRRDVPRLIE